MKQSSSLARHKAEFFRPRVHVRGVRASKPATVGLTLLNVIAVSVVCAVIIGAIWLLLLEAWVLWG